MMKSGDILLFKSESGLSRIISWGTNSPYSHVAVYASGEKNLVIDSIPGRGVRQINMKSLKGSYDVYRVKEKNPYNLEGMISYLMRNLGRKYDYTGVLWLGVLRFFSKINVSLKNTANNWQKKRDYFCSELCYEAFFEGGGLDIVPEVPEADITSPADISRSKIVERISQKEAVQKA